MRPVVSTTTAPAVAPDPPLPPKLAARGTPSLVTARAPAKPPLPPPPPIDWAKMPDALAPAVPMLAWLVTDTSPDALPAPPAPPKLAATEPPLSEKDPATAKPPLPPPPPTDCARMPLD